MTGSPTEIEPTENDSQPARGSGGVTSAFKLPASSWKAILLRVYHQFNDDRLLAIAAGVVFYALLAVFPAITAFVSLYGLFSDPTTVTNHLAVLQELVPASAFGILQEQANRAADGGTMSLGLTSIVALVFAIWSANSGTKAMMDALNVVYGQREERGIVKLNGISLLLTLGTMATLLVALGAVVIVPLLLAAFGVGFIGQLEILRWPILVVLILGGLATLYRFGPSRQQAHWSWLSIGAATAAAGWLAELGAAVVVPFQFRQLQCDLWITGGRRRSHDLDVGFVDRHPDRRRARIRKSRAKFATMTPKRGRTAIERALRRFNFAAARAR